MLRVHLKTRYKKFPSKKLIFLGNLALSNDFYLVNIDHNLPVGLFLLFTNRLFIAGYHINKTSLSIQIVLDFSVENCESSIIYLLL